MPTGFSILSDSGSSLTISFKSVRTGLRLFGVIFSILFAIPIPWAIYHLVAGHCVSNLFTVGFVIVLATLEILTLLELRNEWKLHMVFRFSPGCCSISILPTFFKSRVREFTFDRETTFAPAQWAMNLLSPHREPEVIILPFPMSGEQLFYLYSLFVDFKYGIRAGSFQIGEPDPARKSPMAKYIPAWKRVLRWMWCILLLAILAIRIAISIYEFLSPKE